MCHLQRLMSSVGTNGLKTVCIYNIYLNVYDNYNDILLAFGM